MTLNELKEKMSENNWNSFKIVAERHHNCQLSIVNCQFGEAVKFQFARRAGNRQIQYLVSYISYLISRILYLVSYISKKRPDIPYMRNIRAIFVVK